MLVLIAGVVGLTVSVVTLLQLILLWRAHRVDDAREVADFLDTVFGDVITNDEANAAQLNTDEVRANERRLKDLRQQVHDKKLGVCLGTLSDRWLDVFGNAPPPTDVIEISVYLQRESERRAQTERQVQAARDGKDAANAVKSRCDRLEQFLVRR